ncbi:carbohydrate-binding family 9-like protein [bacterium]|nr:carbohydrate-binding family 9-like protein [bacterium]
MKKFFVVLAVFIAVLGCSKVEEKVVSEQKTQKKEVKTEEKPKIFKKEMKVFTIAESSRKQTKIDGRFEESYWKNASKDGEFWLPRGTEPSPVKTTVMTARDDRYLYVGFIAKDNDIYAGLQNNDDPLYDHDDVVEIFIDPTGRATPYFEMQVSAGGVKFDSRFSGGRRKNRDDSWDSGIVYGVSLDGTLNDPEDKDTGWSAEIAIPLKSISENPPKNGERWKAFFHRINRHTKLKKAKKGDFSAWTPPFGGDFHNIRHMGELIFSDEEIR